MILLLLISPLQVKSIDFCALDSINSLETTAGESAAGARQADTLIQENAEQLEEPGGATGETKDFHNTKERQGSIPITIWILFGTLIATIIIAIANMRMVENATRPIIGLMLVKQFTRGLHVYFDFRNLSNTDAEGLLKLIMYIGDSEVHVADKAYSGRMIWTAPAKQASTGHIDLTTTCNLVPGKLHSRIEMEASVCYRRWCKGRSILGTGKVYYAPVKRWQYNIEEEVWIPILAFGSSIKPYRFDKKIFRSK